MRFVIELNDTARARVDHRRTVDRAAACAALTGVDGTSLALVLQPGIVM